MDKGSIGGVLLAIVGIVAGLLLEGGNLGQILQPTAALIVFGGTMGAVLLQFPLPTVIAAFASLAHIFTAPRKQNDQLHPPTGRLCQQGSPQGRRLARRRPADHQDPFLKRALMLAVDGTEPTELRKIMRVSLDSRRGKRRAAPRGLRIGRRLFAHHRHSRRGAGTDSGDAASGQHSGGGPRHRRCLRRHHLRRRRGKSLLSSLCRQDAHPHARRSSAPRDDAGRCHFHPRRHEPAHAGSQAGRLPE